MKILLLAQKVPYPLHDGYNLHNYQYARQLSSRHELCLVALGEAPAPPEIRGLFREIRLLPSRLQPRDSSFARRLVKALSVDELYDFDPEVLRSIQAQLLPGGFDVVWVSGAKMLVYSRHVEGVPVLGDVADDGVLYTWNEFLRSRTPRQLVRRGKEYLVTRRFERVYFRHAAACNVVAEADRESILRQVPGMDVSVINNGVDDEYFAPLGLAEQHPSLVFEGNMRFPPNAEGVVHFCRQVLPLILQARPETRICIVGKDPPPEVRELAAKQVEITGFVEDVRPHLERASVFVCPLLSGAGIKNKILQAWAMKKPVVATPISCGGLRIVEGENILIAEGRRDFAEAVLRLLADESLRKKLGENGRLTIRKDYSWRAKGLELEQVLTRVAAKRHRV